MIGQTWIKSALIICSSLVFVILLLLAGCCSNSENKDEYPKLTDKATPEWSYDQPYYVKPVDGVKPVKTFDNEIVEYYTSNRLLQIPRPAAGNPRKAPRIAIWLTKDNGMNWKRIGYFGLQQRYFPYEVRTDGVYGIRFIGPGIPPAECKPPRPHMNFYVDTVPPEVIVFVSPDQECYYPGQMLHVEWQANDLNLDCESVQVGICIDSKAEALCWTPLGESYSDKGNIDFVIPDDAIDKSVMMRIVVRDRANNLGQGYSCPVNVIYEPVSVESETIVAHSSSQPAQAIQSEQEPQVLTTMPQTFPSLEE